MNKTSYLDLNEKGLELIEEFTFSGLTELKILILSFNLLTYLPENIFNGLSNLTSLNLSNNNITSMDGNKFIGLDKLKYIDLSSNKFTGDSIGKVFGRFHELVSLRIIQIENNLLDNLKTNHTGIVSFSHDSVYRFFYFL